MVCVSSLPCVKHQSLSSLHLPVPPSHCTGPGSQVRVHPTHPSVTETLAEKTTGPQSHIPGKTKTLEDRQSKVTRERGKGKCCSCSRTALAFQTQKILTERIYCFSHSALGRSEKNKNQIATCFPLKTEKRRKTVSHFHWRSSKRRPLRGLANISIGRDAPRSRVSLWDPTLASENTKKGPPRWPFTNSQTQSSHTTLKAHIPACPSQKGHFRQDRNLHLSVRIL